MNPSPTKVLPLGEGAGYAGGITSAAVDGINAAECLIQSTCDLQIKTGARKGAALNFNLYSL